MKISLEENPIDELEVRVRAIMGVPELILLDEVIASPDFSIRAERYINKRIKEYDELDESLIHLRVPRQRLPLPLMLARMPSISAELPLTPEWGQKILRLTRFAMELRSRMRMESRSILPPIL